MSDDLIDLKKFDEALEQSIKDVYLQRLIANTPFDTGDTSRSWSFLKDDMFKYRFINDSMTQKTKSGANTGKQYPIAELLEFGTKPHIIRPVPPTKSLHWKKGSKDIFASFVKHPGFVARHFIRETFKEKNSEVQLNRAIIFNYF